MFKFLLLSSLSLTFLLHLVDCNNMHCISFTVTNLNFSSTLIIKVLVSKSDLLIMESRHGCVFREVLSTFKSSKVILDSQLPEAQITAIKKCSEEWKDNLTLSNFNELFYFKNPYA